MDNSKDGGCAFPQPCTEDGYAANTPYQIAGGGMSLRDYFAAKAMAAYLPGCGTASMSRVSQVAYEMADAMLAARDEQSTAAPDIELTLTTENQKRVEAERQRDQLLAALEPFAKAHREWGGGNAPMHFSTAVVPAHFMAAAEAIDAAKGGQA